MVGKDDVYRIPAGQKLRVKEIKEEKIIFLNDKGMEVIKDKVSFTKKVSENLIIPEEDYEEIVQEEVESEGPPAWISSD